MVLLEIENLTTDFLTSHGATNAVDDVSFDVSHGELVGLVGESGAGKSVTGLSILGLVSKPGVVSDGSTVSWKGEDLTEKSDREMDAIRGNEIAWVPQDPLSALNPTSTVGTQLKRAMKIHNYGTDAEIHQRAVDLLEEVGIPDAENRLDEYPHEYSGGMRQRVLIAIALSCEPDLIIADEPTTALDVLIQAQIIQLLERLVEERDTALIFISHDLGLVAEICNRVMVMYAGRVVESARTDSLFDQPLHPYTEALMQCSPNLLRGDRLNTIPGSVPSGSDYPSGCRFHPRCPKAMDECIEFEPELREEGDDREVSCFLY